MLYSLLFTCFLNQQTARLAAISYFARKMLASRLQLGLSTIICDLFVAFDHAPTEQSLSTIYQKEPRN